MITLRGRSQADIHVGATNMLDPSLSPFAVVAVRYGAVASVPCRCATCILTKILEKRASEPHDQDAGRAETGCDRPDST